MLLSGLATALGLANPYLTKLIIDRAYVNRDMRLFISLVSVGALIFILNSAISGLNTYLNQYIRLRVNLDLNRWFFKRLQGLSCNFFQDNPSGSNAYKINYDIEQAASFITDTMPQAISLIPRTVLMLIIVLYLDWKITMLALALMPFLWFAPYYFSRRLKKFYKEWVENSQNIFRKLNEALSHIQLVKAFGKESSEVKKYISGLIKNIRFRLKNTRWETTGMLSSTLTGRAILGLIIFYGGYQVINGRMTLGTLSAISIYLTQLAGLQSSATRFFQLISLGIISCERLDKVFEVRAETLEEKSAREVWISGGRIGFEDVSFEYSPAKKIFDNINFSIEKGSCVGFAGPSGCGKTTIINLLLRLYRLDKGSIFIDGYDIREIKAKSLYGQTGVVLQEPFLWDDTIENNIKYGREEAGFKEIEEAARIACIDGFIEGLPQGYDTIIGENACKISEGQKQRIAIARAVIKRPKILVLDEALSSVDSKIEGKIIDNIRDALPDSTIIVISHRLSAIKRMDLVYFLESPGRIDIGRHEELLSRSPVYRDYLSSQLAEAQKFSLTN